MFLGGDLLPRNDAAGFLEGSLFPLFRELRRRLGSDYPRVLLLPGNDDPRALEARLRDGEHEALWTWMHGTRAEVAGYVVYGYANVPPTPFLLKDWERYDVSHHVDPGCVSPEEGVLTTDVDPLELRYRTIAADLEELTGGDDLHRAIVLFHTPPYRTSLDRAALDGKFFDYVPLDVHVGSIAVRRFIEARQPLVTLHGHVHESVRLTGRFVERIGRTVLLGAAHDGPELALVRFDPDEPEAASRELRSA